MEKCMSYPITELHSYCVHCHYCVAELLFFFQLVCLGNVTIYSKLYLVVNFLQTSANQQESQLQLHQQFKLVTSGYQIFNLAIFFPLPGSFSNFFATLFSGHYSMPYQKEWVGQNSYRWEMLNGNCSSIALIMARKTLIKNGGEHNPFLNLNGYDSSYSWEVQGMLQPATKLFRWIRKQSVERLYQRIQFQKCHITCPFAFSFLF